MTAIAPGIPEYLKTSEVAALYGVAQSRVRIWARAGKITGTHPGGGHWRFPSVQFAEVIRANGGIPPRRGQS